MAKAVSKWTHYTLESACGIKNREIQNLKISSFRICSALVWARNKYKRNAMARPFLMLVVIRAKISGTPKR